MKGRENKSGLEKRRQRRKQGVHREAERKRFRRGGQAKQPDGERQDVPRLWLYLLLFAPAPVSKSTSLTISCPDSEAGGNHCAAPHVSIVAGSPYMAAALPYCRSKKKKSPSMSRKCFYSLPLSTCHPSYRGLMFQWPWCGHTGSLGEFFKYFDWLQRRK